MCKAQLKQPSILNGVRLGHAALAQIKVPHAVEECVEFAKDPASFDFALACVEFDHRKFAAPLRMLFVN